MQATDSETLTHIASNITRLRGERSMGWLARSVDVGTIHISRIEAGDVMPGSGLLVRIASALGVTPNDLLSSPKKKSKPVT